MTRAHGAASPPLTGGISASSSPAASGASPSAYSRLTAITTGSPPARSPSSSIASFTCAPSGSSIESSMVPARSRSCAKRRTVTCMVGMLRRLMWRLKLLAARARRRLAGPQPDREDVVRRHAAGKTFCDVGCMWKVHGRIAFVAEEAGATAVTGVDVMEATPEFQAEHERRSSKRPLRARRPARPCDRRRGRAARGGLVQRRALPRAQPGPHAPAPARAHDRAPDPPDDDAARAAGREAGARLLPGRAGPSLYARWGEDAAGRCGCRSRARTRTRPGGGGSPIRRSTRCSAPPASSPSSSGATRSPCT